MFVMFLLYNLMKIKILLLLLYVAAVALCGPTILFVSGKPGSIDRPVFSSLRGGRLIYIKALGHDPDPSNLKVYIGTFPCIIPSDGVTDTFISC